MFPLRTLATPQDCGLTTTRLMGSMLDQFMQLSVPNVLTMDTQGHEVEIEDITTNLA
jgi:hypothetical protein